MIGHRDSDGVDDEAAGRSQSGGRCKLPDLELLLCVEAQLVKRVLPSYEHQRRMRTQIISVGLFISFRFSQGEGLSSSGPNFHSICV